MRLRILWAMLAVTAAAVTAFAIPLGVTTVDRYRDTEVRELQQTATLLLTQLPDTGIEAGATIPIPNVPGDAVIGLYDLEGVLLSGDGPSDGGAVVSEALAGAMHSARVRDHLVVGVPVLDENMVIGAVRLSEPWSIVAAAASRRWTLMAIAGLAALAAAGVLGIAIARRLVAPIDELVDVAVRLGDGDFGARVAPSRVAELDRAGQALNRTAERLDELVSRERAFAADVSHQLSTPLTSLRLGLESALLAPEGDAQAIGRAVDEVDRLQTTIQTLMHVARDRPTSTTGTADLAGLCRVVIERRAAGLRDGARSVVIDSEEAIPEVACPAPVLSEIIGVLVDNAILHGEGTVRVEVRRRGSGATVAVGDDGAGVPADRVDRVFTRRDPGAGGNGIGLALAQSLARAHELRLELTRPGPQPIFTVACPGVVDDDATRLSQPERSGPSS